MQVHHGTRESPARVVPIEGERLDPGARAYAQVRLEAPLVPSARDRLVLRRLALPATIGGAVALDVRPRKHGPSREVVERLLALQRGEQPEEPANALPPLAESVPPPPPDGALTGRIAEMLDSDASEPQADIQLAESLEVTPMELKAALGALVREGRVVRVGPAQHFSAAALAALSERVVALCRREGSVTIASVRDDLATSRKYAYLVLGHLARTRATRRRGDEHVLRPTRR